MTGLVWLYFHSQCQSLMDLFNLEIYVCQLSEMFLNYFIGDFFLSFFLKTPIMCILSQLGSSLLIFLVFLLYFPYLCLLLYFLEDILKFISQLLFENYLMSLA